MKVIARAEGKQELDGHTIHMCHRQNAQCVAELRHVDAQLFLAEIHVSPQRTIGQHDSLRKSCRSRRVVNHAEFLGISHIPMYVIPAERVRVLSSEQFVQPFAGVCQFFVMRNVKREVR